MTIAEAAALVKHTGTIIEQYIVASLNFMVLERERERELWLKHVSEHIGAEIEFKRSDMRGGNFSFNFLFRTFDLKFNDLIFLLFYYFWRELV